MEGRLRGMVGARDVAAYIVRERGCVSTIRLHKLLYYSQAWSLVWDARPLFSERIEAWTNGPVVPELYEVNQGRFEVAEVPGGDPAALDAAQRETVEAVLAYYGDRPAQWLSDLARCEIPWQEARRGLGPCERGERVIPLESLAEYFGSLEPGF